MTLANSISQLILAKRVQQNLKANPNDIDSLVLLASMIKDNPALKRDVVERILKLEPTNKFARTILLDLDRAEMFNVQSVAAVPILETPAAPDIPSARPQLEKPLVFRYSIIPRLLVYLLMVFSIFNVYVSTQVGETVVFLCFGAPHVLLLIPVWSVTAVVRIDNAGVRLTRMFGLYRREIEWEEIESLQQYDVGAGVKLTSKQGRSIRFSRQMTRYPNIVESLSRIRPDLYNAADSRVFRKSLFGVFGWLLILVPATILSIGSIVVPPFLHSILLGLVLFYWWKTYFFGVRAVQVQGDRLTARSLLKKHEFTAGQIKNINVVVTRTSRGVPKKWVQIELEKGGDLMLSGFPEGNQAMYDFLSGWWSTYNTA